jgi:Protein of unknown function (DUF3995)
MMSRGRSVALGGLGWVLVWWSTEAPWMADQPNRHRPAPPTRSRTTAWAAYPACALAWLSAVPSLYWALGGTAGLDTLGGAIEQLARTRDPAGIALGLGAGLLKVAGGLLALALVRPWGRVIPGRLLGGIAWTAGAVLTCYGGLLVVVGALVLGGLISPSGPVDRTALRWHVLLWDLWFLVWGLLLGVAAWQYGRESGRRGTR